MIHQQTRKHVVQAAVAAILAGVFLAACGVSLMPSNDPWYTQHYYIMQDFERTAYRKLADASKPEFQNLFWAARQPASKQVFEERMNYVLSAFKRENSRQPWNTDRARIYLLNGPPANIEIDQNWDWAGTMGIGQPGVSGLERSGEDVRADRAEVWTYSFEKQYIKYGFVFRAPNEWRMSMPTQGNKFIGDLERYNRTVTFGIRDPQKYNQDIQALAKKS